MKQNKYRTYYRINKKEHYELIMQKNCLLYQDIETIQFLWLNLRNN